MIKKQSYIEGNRKLVTRDINLEPGYRIEVFAQGFDAPSCMAFTPEGDILVGESGYISGEPKVLRINNGQIDLVADGFLAPLSGITYKEREIYVSHLSKVTVIREDGTKRNIVEGLPSFGDHWNSNVTFGPDQKMYFGLGTATNSGVVGIDNLWIDKHPNLCDHPGSYIMLVGQNYETRARFLEVEEIITTGAFSPYGVSNLPYEVRKGILKASGSILRTNPDGSEMELVAWGFRFPTHLKYDNFNRLFVSNQGPEVRGSRPIANAPDEFQLVQPGNWYGWPDFCGGEPVILPKFKPEGKRQPEFLLTSHPGIPMRPYAAFSNQSFIVGFDFNYNTSFGYYGDTFIAEFGTGGRIEDSLITFYAGIGHRISRINMDTGEVTTFAINKSGFPAAISGEGGFERPVDVKFGPDGAMYIVDFGMNSPSNPSFYYENTGVIWRITRM